ncbi:DNA-dependent RNA polymerase 35 kDa subunit) [Equine molluscum contagiosum-like virus]|nr:DNA-dependent RNA polymerase 35 kDa subunit) [Equine molluscum contagiosum-like virus]
MLREERVIRAELAPSLATFLKHGYNRHLRWPVLNLGVVLANTTTSINEEWLTAVESMPTRKVFYEYAEQVLTRELRLCVYLKKVQTENDSYVSMHDFEYYVVREDATLVRVEKPAPLRETLVHTFLDYRLKNTKAIELIAFSSGTAISDELVNNLSFLDIEVFNREHANIRGTFSDEDKGVRPFMAIAPRGCFTLFLETYPWVDTRAHVGAMLRLLEARLEADVRAHQLRLTRELSFEDAASQYDKHTHTLLVRDLVTMSIANFFGAHTQLDTYHQFDMSVVDVERFLAALKDAFAQLHAQL